MDDSLDDFFAKKDKSKKKSKSSKSKFVAAELLPPSPSGSPVPPNNSVGDGEIVGTDSAETQPQAVCSTDGSTEIKKKSKRKKDKEAGADGVSREDDEWNEVVSEIDYSGLRIQTKSLAKEPDDEGAESNRAEPEYDEDGKIIEKPQEAGVWKKPQPTVENDDEQSDTSAPLPEPASPQPVQELAAKIPTRYVPPSLRGQAAELAPITLKRSRGKKVAPNISSTDDFPTLGSAPPPPEPDLSNFEKVRGGGRNDQPQNPGNQRVETSNIFSALQR